MPIMAVQDQEDARDAARLLASSALRSVTEFNNSQSQRVALSGLFRLLKAYKAHRLAGFVYRPEREVGEGLALEAMGDTHIRDLRVALSMALATTFGENADDQGVNVLEGVLKDIASREAVDAGRIHQTQNFLDAFLENLDQQPA